MTNVQEYITGKLGSCTANALAAAYEFNEIQRNIIIHLFLQDYLFTAMKEA